VVPPRLLLTRPDHLGDVLLSLPAATALRAALPDATIAYLVRPEAAPVVERAGVVDEVLTAPFPSPTASDGVDDDLVDTVAPRLRGRFDVALVFRPADPWTASVAAAAGIPNRIGFDQPSTRRHLTMALPDDPSRPVADLGLDLALAAAGLFGAITTRPTYADVRIVPTADDEAEAADLLASAGSAECPPVMVHPGSGWPLKNWPVTRWGRLAASLGERYGVPIVTGTAEEAELVQAVVDASGGGAAGVAGELSIGGLAALSRRAQVVVATDSGPLHLAALAGSPVVGIYGPASPTVFGPWCPPQRFRAVWANLPCSPCGTLVDPPCRASVQPACVDAVSIEQVLAAVAAVQPC